MANLFILFQSDRAKLRLHGGQWPSAPRLDSVLLSVKLSSVAELPNLLDEGVCLIHIVY